MDSRVALQAGDVRLASDLLRSDVRRSPRDAKLRVYLFQLLCITGEWDRALNQLSVVGELDPSALPMVRTYEIAIRCEVLRQKVFAGERTPTVFGEPGEWLPLLIEALRLSATGRNGDAVALRASAFDQASAIRARVDDNEVDWVADADPRLGPVMEAIVEGRYVWIPFNRIRTLRIEPPSDLRDQVWLPVHFTWENDGTADGFVPTRYPGTTAQSDPLLLLGRRTEWIGDGDGSLPVGQRMLVTDQTEIALMDLRRLDLHPPSVIAAA